MLDDSKSKFPIDDYLPKITSLLQENRSVIIRAAPGAGKTTRVPLALLSLGQPIIMVQPRRIAARLTAEWMAKTLGEEIGGKIGYQIRFDSRFNSQTQILVVTEGVLTRKFVSTPMLPEYGIVILDEFHERHIHSDIALGFIKELMNRREDLRLVVMSATLDTSQLEDFLPSAKVFDVPGQMYPVEIQYRPLPTPHGDWEDHIAKNIDDLSRDPRCPGHLLVFLTGAREIQRVKTKLRHYDHDREVLILTSETSQVFFEHFRQVSQNVTILATNVAETSITLSGVTGIVDGGQCKMAGFAPWSGLPTLEIHKISRASSIQRAGRSGRTGPGICYRLYDEHCFRSRLEFTPPEVKRIDLTQVVLEGEVIKKKLGISEFPWFERPRDNQLEASHTLLQGLGALTTSGDLTADGYNMAQWPLHPRLSRMVIDGKSINIGEAALLGALLLNEGGRSLSPVSSEDEYNCDLLRQVQLVALNREFLDHSDRLKIRRLLQLYENLKSLCKVGALNRVKSCQEKQFRKIVFRAFADRVAQLRIIENKGKKNERVIYHFSMGNEGILHNTSSISSPTWLIALEAEQLKDGVLEERKTRIIAACTVDEEWLYEDPFNFIKEKIVKSMNGNGVTPIFRETIYYGELILREKFGQIDDQKSTQEVLLEHLISHWDMIYDGLLELKKFHQKLRIMDDLSIPHGMPYFTDEYLLILQDSLIDSCKTWDEVKSKNLKNTIYSLLNYNDLTLLNEMFPESYTLENGKKLKIHYNGVEDPFLEAKIQEFFGQNNNPQICQGRFTLVIKLLAPNYRPTQITRDLTSFWKSSYSMIRKELRARYPRHPWPENPDNYQEIRKKKDTPITG
jgi:ATP-dependent helicase HrpB